MVVEETLLIGCERNGSEREITPAHKFGLLWKQDSKGQRWRIWKRKGQVISKSIQKLGLSMGMKKEC